MADIKGFIKKRASIKAKLTQFTSYLNISKSCEKLSEVQIVEIEYRLNIFESLYEKYDALQNELEALVDDPNEQYAEREEFERLYCGLVASARQLISGARRLLKGDSASAEVDSCIANAHKHSSIRLPKIDIPKFSGSYHDWLEFRDTFVSIIHNNNNLDKINKLHYLRASLSGSASLVIDNLDFKSENYDAAWRLLCERYDNKRLLVNNHVQALFNVKPVDRESSKSLRHIIDTTNKNLRALATLGQPVQNAFVDVLIIYIMTSKLDSITNRRWEEHRNTLHEPPTLSTFTNFISSRADLLETIEESKPIGAASSEPTAPTAKHKSSTVPERSSKPLSCPMCRQDHFIFACEDFKKLSVQARIKKAQNSKIYMNCLRPGHDVSKCKLGNCKYCRHKHNTLLHIDNENVLPSAHNTALSANQSSTSRIILLSTALVRVTDADGNHHTARVLLDSGSTTNFISEDFVRKLLVPTYITNSKVTGINSHISSCSQGCSVSLTSIDDSEYELKIDCLVLPKVSASVPHTYVDTSNICIPTHVRLADPTYYVPSSIDVLVGAEVFWGIIGTGRIALGTHKPTLLESKLGWLISGAYHQSDSSSSNTQVCMLTNQLQVDLDRFWELDSVSSIHKHSDEERSCEQHFKDTTYRNTDGRFVVSIPFKESPDVLGDSYMMAKQRFLSLERRLCRDPGLKHLYINFINEYIELGHMSESARRPLNSTCSNYLPHHGVLKESRNTTKLRVVFDASAKTASGKSFNQIQMVGPPIQDDLLSILLRFRQHKIVISADIEKMYRQTLVQEMNRPLQKILWRAEPTHPLKEYTLNTVTYGTASAPFLATRCLLQLAEECSDSSTKFSISRDFYVDDYLSGGSSVSETLEKSRRVNDVLRSAKYNLRKWRSNSSQVLQALSDENNVSEVVDLSDNEQSKTLGLLWKSLSDTFSFSINLSSTEKATKRHILSTIAQTFDPVGLVVPCIVEAKIIMQQLWLAKCCWDELVPTHIQYAWDDFQKNLHLLNEFKIPRWVLCESASCLQLHIFTDASEKAYGACVYVRSVSRDGEVSVHLLTAKSKVAPIKSTTIPRLELCGALLGSRLYSKIQNANVNSLKRFRRIEYLKQHFWTRFSHDYVLWLQEKTKWCRSSGELKKGTLVVIKDKTLPPLMWLLGRITHVLPGRDGVARVADILTRKGVIRRAFNTICPLPVATTVEDSSTGGVC